MKFLIGLTTTACLLSGCATIVDERSRTAVLQSGFNAGERYEIRTRTMEGPNGRYDTTSVVYKGASSICIIDSPGDCEKAARVLIDSFDERFL